MNAHTRVKIQMTSPCKTCWKDKIHTVSKSPIAKVLGKTTMPDQMRLRYWCISPPEIIDIQNPFYNYLEPKPLHSSRIHQRKTTSKDICFRICISANYKRLEISWKSFYKIGSCRHLVVVKEFSNMLFAATKGKAHKGINRSESKDLHKANIFAKD